MTLAFLPRLLNSVNSKPSLSPTVISIALFVLGTGSLWLYHWARDLHRFIQGISGYTALFIAQFAIYLLACYLATRRTAPASQTMKLVLAAIVIIFAAAFRFDLVVQRPYLSTDVYRYVWDGRVQARGLNPYVYAPSAPELEPLRDNKIYPHINRSDFVRTPYPPVAQLIFFAAYLLNESSVTGFKVLMTLCDLLALIALMMTLTRVGLSAVYGIIFAWHPLLIYEGAHTGHLESGFILFLALALLARSYRKNALTGVMLGLATLVKFYPALLVPAFLYARENSATEEQGLQSGLQTLLNKANLKILTAFALTIPLAYLPYLGAGVGAFGSLSNEASEEGFTGTGSRYFLLVLIRKLVPLPTGMFLIIAALAFLALGVKTLLKKKQTAVDVAQASIALLGLYFFFVTPRYAWYYAWILPFLCFTPRISWLYLTGASVLLYCLWFTPLIYPDIPVWLGLSIYAPTALFLIWEKWKAKQTALADKLRPVDALEV
jgi:alpha-1,6-mannosyltransferase